MDLFQIFRLTGLIILLGAWAYDIFLNSNWFRVHPRYGIPFFKQSFYVTQKPDLAALQSTLGARLNREILPEGLSPFQKEVFRSISAKNEFKLNMYDSETIFYWRRETKRQQKLLGRIYWNKATSQVEVTGYFVWPSSLLPILMIAFWILFFFATIFIFLIFLLPGFIKQRKIHQEVGKLVQNILLASPSSEGSLADNDSFKSPNDYSQSFSQEKFGQNVSTGSPALLLISLILFVLLILMFILIAIGFFA